MVYFVCALVVSVCVFAFGSLGCFWGVLSLLFIHVVIFDVVAFVVVCLW